MDLSLSFKRKKTLDTEELYHFTNKLYLLIHSGVDLRKSLLSMSSSKNKFYFENIILNLDRGKSLSYSMKEEDIFPQILINLVAVGEETGKLEEASFIACEYFKSKLQLEKKMKKSMVYPSLLIVVSSLIFIFMLIYIIPSFKKLLSLETYELPIITRLIFKLSDIISEKAYIFLLFPILYFIFKFYIKARKKDKIYHKYKIKYSPFKKINQNLINYKIINYFKVMYSIGMPIDLILESLIDFEANKYIKEKLIYLQHDVNKGSSLSEGLYQVNILPNFLVDMIRVGEETGKLDYIFSNIKDYYEIEIYEDIDRKLSLLEPLLIIVISIFIGGSIIGITIPMLDYINSFS